MSVTAAVKRRAEELGFVACGVTDPGPIPDGGWLDRWLARGYAGAMRYLHRQARKRKDPRLIVPEARSVVVVLDNYYDGHADPGPPPRVARYARGQDYHRVTRERLEPIAEVLRSHGARVAHSYVDSGPVPERALALRAGLGWIGKNTMLIRQGTGSFFFIGTIFTDLALDPDRDVATDHCGSCTRCLEACPTGALVEPRVLDATRCISYLTIEQKGPIPEEIVPHLDGWAFGCDACNDACPWNQRFATPTTVLEFQAGSDILRDALESLADMDEAEFSVRFEESPLARAGPDGLRRNLRAVGLGGAAERCDRAG
jgi:epoxyqueuosine reductase